MKSAFDIDNFEFNTEESTHERICNELREIYNIKNKDYGDSFHKSFEKWGMAAPCMRLEDKLNRLINLTKPGAESARVNDESIEDTLLDLANYAILTMMELRRER